jgi:hypothetical protein
VFTGFKKIQILAQIPKGLAFRFNKKRQFAAKTNQNSIFLDRKTYILDRLYIMVHYTSFSIF